MKPLYYNDETKDASKALGESILKTVERDGLCYVSKELLTNVIISLQSWNSRQKIMVKTINRFCTENSLEYKLLPFNVIAFTMEE